MDRKYSRLLCRAIPNSSITCPPSPAIMRLRRVRFSNGATNLYWVRLYTAQYDWLTLKNRYDTFRLLEVKKRMKQRILLGVLSIWTACFHVPSIARACSVCLTG